MDFIFGRCMNCYAHGRVFGGHETWVLVDKVFELVEGSMAYESGLC